MSKRKLGKRIISIMMSAIIAVPLLAGVPAKDMSKVQAATLSNPRTDASGVVTWDCVYFGRYPQSDAKGNTKDPIKWRVLSVNGNDAFLVADKNLDVHEYHYNFVDTTWETSTVRSWLNGYGYSSNNGSKDYTTSNFIDRAFYDVEQDAILTTKVENPDNPAKNSDSGNDTEDKLFLLSYKEMINKDFGHFNTIARIRKNTAFVAAGGSNGSVNTSKVGEANDFWLRTIGSSARQAVFVTVSGGISYDGYDVESDMYAICPALHLNLSKTILWSYAGTVNSNGVEDTTLAEAVPVVDPNAKSETKDDAGQPNQEGTYTETTADGSTEKTLEYTGPKDSNSETVQVPDTVTVYDEEQKSEVTYKVTSIAANAFKDNKNIKEIVIGKNITSIGKNAFRNCSNLKKVTIGDNVTSIGDSAFYGCPKLTSVKIGKNVTTIGAKAFYKCKKLTTITIPSKVTKIGDEAFSLCSALRTVKMGSAVKSIENKAFYKCIKLTKIELPKQVNYVGKQAFYGCKNLKTITIKTTKLNSKKLKSQAFKGIYSKAKIKVPNGKVSSYKKLLKSRGVSSSAKIYQ